MALCGLVCAAGYGSEERGRSQDVSAHAHDASIHDGRSALYRPRDNEGRELREHG